MAGSRSVVRAPGERFEWLETAEAAPSKLEVAEGAEALPARRCPACGWLDEVTCAECFRCGERWPPPDLIEAGEVRLPEPSVEPVSVTLTPAASLRDGGLNDDPSTWLLRRRAADFSRVPGFETLLALSQVNQEAFHRYAHQQSVARRALREMGGAALLADETGLGKTIEAGLVAKELLVRGLVRSVLVVVPASLGIQWREEMHDKFNLDFVFAREPAELKDDPPLVIASYAGLRGKALGARLQEREVDLLICDEAHHLKNRSTKQYKAVARVRKKYVLLLSATPFHNRLVELKNLLDILKPGLLGSTRAFNKQYVDEKDPRKPRNLHHLRALLDEVMIRNRRGEVAVKLPPRRAAIYHVELNEDEQSFYDELSEFIGGEVQARALAFSSAERPASLVLSLINLQRELCSSPHAVAGGLDRMAVSDALPLDVRERLREFADRARGLEDAWRKARAVEEVLARFPDQKLVVFCEFRATIDALVERLGRDGITARPFHGGLNPVERAAALRSFREDDRVLVASKAGSEGLNIQFCSTVLNFDLPWNPMVVEQRIGRVHRLGQTRPVTVVNLSVKGTIEARILDLLTSKLRLFTAVLGEVDLILGSLHSERSFDDLLREVWVRGTTSGALDRELDAFGRQLEEARAEYERIKEAEGILDALAPRSRDGGAS